MNMLHDIADDADADAVDDLSTLAWVHENTNDFFSAKCLEFT